MLLDSGRRHAIRLLRQCRPHRRPNKSNHWPRCALSPACRGVVLARRRARRCRRATSRAWLPFRLRAWHAPASAATFSRRQGGAGRRCWRAPCPRGAASRHTRRDSTTARRRRTLRRLGIQRAPPAAAARTGLRRGHRHRRACATSRRMKRRKSRACLSRAPAGRPALQRLRRACAIRARCGQAGGAFAEAGGDAASRAVERIERRELARRGRARGRRTRGCRRRRSSPRVSVRRACCGRSGFACR